MVGHAHQRGHASRLRLDDGLIRRLQAVQCVLHVDDDEIEARAPKDLHRLERRDLHPGAEAAVPSGA